MEKETVMTTITAGNIYSVHASLQVSYPGCPEPLRVTHFIGHVYLFPRPEQSVVRWWVKQPLNPLADIRIRSYAPEADCRCDVCTVPVVLRVSDTTRDSTRDLLTRLLDGFRRDQPTTRVRMRFQLLLEGKGVDRLRVFRAYVHSATRRHDAQAIEELAADAATLFQTHVSDHWSDTHVLLSSGQAATMYLAY